MHPIEINSLLLSALIKAVEEIDEKNRETTWSSFYEPDWYNEAKQAIESALNIETT